MLVGWHPWRPQGTGRMMPGGVWTGTRPAGSAGEAEGWWLNNDAIWRVPRLNGGAAWESQSLECCCLPSCLLDPCCSSMGALQPGQVLPACCCCPTSTRSSFCLHAFLCFFFDGSSDVQEKRIKASESVKQAFLLSEPSTYSSREHHAGWSSTVTGSCAVWRMAGWRQAGQS